MEPPGIPKTRQNDSAQRKNSNECATWVENQQFEFPLNDELLSESPEILGSPLPESVTSWQGLMKSVEKKRRSEEKKAEIEKKRKRIEPSRSASPSFFEILDRTNKSILGNPSKWVKVNGIWIERATWEAAQNPPESSGIPSGSSDGPKSKYDEVNSLFRRNTEVYHNLHFDNAYEFDWNHYSKDAFQYVIFTKICQSHPEGTFVEMRKEDLKCKDCGSSDLATTIRLTIPLDLTDVPIPCFQDVQIHVALLADAILEKSGIDSMERIEKSVEFSKSTCKRMYALYRKMVDERIFIREYKEWFDRLKLFVKNSLFSKSLQLFHGQVVRRKVVEDGVDSKKRCLIFAHSFDIN